MVCLKKIYKKIKKYGCLFFFFFFFFFLRTNRIETGRQSFRSVEIVFILGSGITLVLLDAVGKTTTFFSVHEL